MKLKVLDKELTSIINEAIKVLKDILIRMEGHSFKKKNELRALNVAKKALEALDKDDIS